MSGSARATQAVDRFIAFFDVLGWKHLVQTEEKENECFVERSVDALNLIYTELERLRGSYKEYGPVVCPGGQYASRDMDFRCSTFSDNVALSVEVSPVALVNLLHCCSVVYFKLFSRKGLMCRGYVTRGRLHHTSRYCLGSGLNKAVREEARVNFRSEDGEGGTPFIQIDESVVSYIEEQPPADCVVHMFQELVQRDGCLTAVFPFKRLDPSVFGDGNFGPEEARRNVEVVRSWIENAREMVRHNASNPSARKKRDCLTRMLDAQAIVCDEWEARVATMAGAYPSR